MVNASAEPSGLPSQATGAASGPRRAAQFVGRVGALAVALGVGVGVGLAPAVGLADPAGPVGGAGSDTTVSAGGSGSGSAAGSTPRPPVVGRRGGRGAVPVDGGGVSGPDASATPRGPLVAGGVSGRASTAVTRSSSPGSPVPAASVPSNSSVPVVVPGVAAGVGSDSRVGVGGVPVGDGSGTAVTAVPRWAERRPDRGAAAAALAAARWLPSWDQSVPAAPILSLPAVKAPSVTAPVTGLLSRVLAVLGLNGVKSAGNPLEAFGLLAWGAFRELETRTRVGASLVAAPAAASSNGAPRYVGAVVTSSDRATGVLVGSVEFTDPSGLTLTYSGPVTSTGGATVSVGADGTYTYTPTQVQRLAATASSVDTFVVTVSNGVSSASKTVKVPGTWLAGTPTYGGAALTGSDRATGVLLGSVAFTDPAGRSLSYSGPVTSVGGATVSVLADGTYTYTPTQAQRQAATASSADTFTVTVTNGVNSASKTVTVPGTWLAGTPTYGGAVATGSDRATGVLNGSVAFTDPAGRALTYSGSTTSTDGATVSVLADGSYTYTPTQIQRQGGDGVECGHVPGDGVQWGQQCQ